MPDKMVIRMSYKNTTDTFGANQFENVFAYEDISGSGTTEDLAEAFVSNILPAIRQILSTSVIFLQLYTINLDDLGDFDLRTIGGTGNQTGDVLPMFTGYAYRYVRTNREVNDGRKTFAGVPESAQNNGVVSGAILTDVNNLADLLEGLLTGAGSDYTPRIWRRAGTYGTPPVVFPDTFYPISSVQFVRLSTQNTRKR